MPLWPFSSAIEGQSLAHIVASDGVDMTIIARDVCGVTSACRLPSPLRSRKSWNTVTLRIVVAEMSVNRPSLSVEVEFAPSSAWTVALGIGWWSRLSNTIP